MDKDYIDQTNKMKEYFEKYIAKGFPYKKVDGYSVYITNYHDGIYFRFQTSLIRWKLDDGMTLKDLEQRLIQDLPFIESVQFYDETPYGWGILI